MHLFSLAALLALLLVGTSYAQVYLGSSGNEWGGSCDNSCPQSAPCQLSTSGATTMGGSCVLFFESGMAIPSHFYYMDVGGNITFSSLGTVSLAGQLRAENRGGGIVLQDLILDTASYLWLQAPEIFIFDSSVTLTSGAQISILGAVSSSVVVRDSNFSTAVPLMRWELAANANVTISGIRAELSQGISYTMNTARPNVHIRDSYITGLEFHAAPFKDITLENVVGTLSTVMFEQNPEGNFVILNSTIASTMNSWLADLYGGDIRSLNVSNSHFENVALRASVYTTVKLENSTFTLFEHYDSVIHINTVQKVIFTSITVSSLTATGSATSMVSFGNIYGVEMLLSDVVYSSPSTIPRLGMGNFMVRLLANTVLPTLYLTNNMYFYGTYAHEFSGDITCSSGTPSTLLFAENASVVLHSISLADGVSFSVLQPTVVPEFAYRVTDPQHGIKCANGAACINQPNPSTRIIWDPSLPLPVLGEPYPYINSSNTVATFVSDAPEYILSSSNAESVSYFSFHEAPPSNIVPIEMNTPSGNTPSPTGNPPSVPSSTPSSQGTPTQSPDSVPTTQPSATPTQSPDPVPTTQPSATPVSNSPSSPTSSASPLQATAWCVSLALISILLFNF